MAKTASHCPATKAAHLLGDKWVLLILRAMLLGATRYSDFNAAVPRISPSVLSGRLRQLTEDGLIVRKGASGQQASYYLTPSGRECEPMLMFLALWGKKWADRTIADEDYDIGGAMWDFHRSILTEELPDGETVLSITLTDTQDHTRWWIVASNGEVDLCNDDPGKNVDLYMRAGLKDLIAIWSGDLSLHQALSEDTLMLTGEAHLSRSASKWFPISPVVRREWAREEASEMAVPA